jgi:hypothetical protein
MKRVLSIIVFILCLFWNTHVFSGNLQKTDKNLENIARQYVKCAAYYQLVSESFKGSGNGKAANSYLALRDTAKSYSIALASESRGQDIAVQLINSRFKMRKRKLSNEIYYQYENIATLIDKYHFGCQEIVQTPSAELTAILAKEMRKHLQFGCEREVFCRG